MNRTHALIATALLSLSIAATAACVKPLDASIDQIPSLESLPHVMRANETIAGRQWGKIGEDSYTDQELAALKDTGVRMAALAERGKSFSRGPIYDKHNEGMIQASKTLAAAADAKDAKGASSSLASMKQLCKDCHSATR